MTLSGYVLHTAAYKRAYTAAYKRAYSYQFQNNWRTTPVNSHLTIIIIIEMLKIVDVHALVYVLKTRWNKTKINARIYLKNLAPNDHDSIVNRSSIMLINLLVCNFKTRPKLLYHEEHIANLLVLSFADCYCCWIAEQNIFVASILPKIHWNEYVSWNRRSLFYTKLTAINVYITKKRKCFVPQQGAV